eukprot:scaffold26710_cov113-Skeletonema_menzelii.AAC.5
MCSVLVELVVEKKLVALNTCREVIIVGKIEKIPIKSAPDQILIPPYGLQHVVQLDDSPEGSAKMNTLFIEEALQSSPSWEDIDQVYIRKRRSWEDRSKAVGIGVGRGVGKGVGGSIGAAVGDVVGTFVGDGVAATVGGDEGALVGDEVAAAVGDVVGALVGDEVAATVGDVVVVASVGDEVAAGDGAAVGAEVVGSVVGTLVGRGDGSFVGTALVDFVDEDKLGSDEGPLLGSEERWLGFDDGLADLESEGDKLGSDEESMIGLGERWLGFNDGSDDGPAEVEGDNERGVVGSVVLVLGIDEMLGDNVGVRDGSVDTLGRNEG